MKKSNFKILIFYFILILAIIVSLSFMFRQGNAEVITYGDVMDYFQKDAVVEFVVDSDHYLTMKVYELDANGEIPRNDEGEITAKTKTIGFQLQSLGLFVEDFGDYYKGNQNLTEFDIEPEKTTPFWVMFLP